LKATGFTPEEFNTKLEEQGGVCAICGTDNPGKLDFCADHDHANGTKRGVLCRKCNSGLGHFNDDPEIISKAINYLIHYTK
jgi:peptide methionine sulfoxide reductase MsrB